MFNLKKLKSVFKNGVTGVLSVPYAENAGSKELSHSENKNTCEADVVLPMFLPQTPEHLEHQKEHLRH